MVEPVLTVLPPEGPSWVVPVRGRTVLGRVGPDVILPDNRVSKAHAEIVPSGATWLLHDLASRNGTYVNDVLVDAIALADGDVVRIGPFRVRFAVPRPSSAARTLAATLVPIDGEPHVRATLPAAAEFPPAAAQPDPAALARDYEKLRLAHELGRILADAPDAEEAATRVLEFCLHVLPADGGAVLAPPEGGGTWGPLAARTRDGATTLLVSRRVLSRLAVTGEALLVDDADVDPDLQGAGSIREPGVRSLLAVPLRVRDRLLGCIVLDNRHEAAAFTPRDLALLTGIASQAAQAMDRVRLMRRAAAEAERRLFLSRFLNPAAIAHGAVREEDLAPRLRPRVTVLFADIRGFTATSARIGPERTVALLDVFFEVAVATVFAHGGVVDKFIGDAVMALWGAPEANPDDELRAVTCALDLVARLEMRNRAGQDPPLHVGVGVHAGPAVVGRVGAHPRFEFTAIGATVNLASRLAGHAGAGEVLTTEDTLARDPGAFRAEERLLETIKGVGAPPPVLHVVGHRRRPAGR